MRFLSLRAALLLAPLALGLGACGDPTFGRLDPLIAVDTFVIAVPTAASQTPSALDVSASAGFVRGGRFPERVEHAGAWDLALGLQEGQLVFLPPAAFGFVSRAGITQPLVGQTFEGVREVPAGARFVTDSAVVVQPEAIYVVRSREFASLFGSCLQYAKLQPLEADAEAGTLRVQVSTNERCFDTRLVAAGS